MAKNKRLRNFFILYVIIVIVIILADFTFSRMYTSEESSADTQIAKFNVKINGIVVSDDTNFNLKLSENSNTYKNKLAPDSNGYFTFEINPDSSEVSVEYQLVFDLNNDNTNIKLTKYSIDGGSSFKEDIENGNTIKGQILLKDTSTGLTEADKVNLTVYWEWDDEKDIYNPQIDDKTISVFATVKQIIE